MDDALLRWALQQAQSERPAGGIGTLGEHVLHATLKYCYEPDARFHEVPAQGFVADILRKDGIVEIQTGSFYPLRKKLPALLAVAPVTVVHPLAVKRRILTVSPQDGTLGPPRTSPRPQRPCDLLEELFWISEWLAWPGLRVEAPLLAVDEYRLPPPGGRGAVRRERIPTAVLGQCAVTQPRDMAALLPAGLAQPFTAAHFAQALRLRGRRAFYALRVLTEHGVVRDTGRRQGRAALYALCEGEDGP